MYEVSSKVLFGWGFRERMPDFRVPRLQLQLVELGCECKCPSSSLRVVRRGDPVVGQRVVHVIRTDLVQGRIPDGVFSGEQVGQELDRREESGEVEAGVRRSSPHFSAHRRHSCVPGEVREWQRLSTSSIYQATSRPALDFQEFTWSSHNFRLIYYRWADVQSHNSNRTRAASKHNSIQAPEAFQTWLTDPRQSVVCRLRLSQTRHAARARDSRATTRMSEPKLH